MTPYLHHFDGRVALYHGDASEVVANLADGFVDAIVTDPPYELGFMGKSWDSSGIAYNVELWRQCLRVLKPGGHLLAFGGTRTYHRLAVAIEDAGFEIRDSISWIYSQGFPKGLDVSKAIDRAASAERPVVGLNPRAAQQTAKSDATSLGRFAGTSPDLTAPATDAAKQWAGWGTALKPAMEPVVVARKPFTGTVAANVLEHGTGAINIDATRVGDEARINAPRGIVGGTAALGGAWRVDASARETVGRWPSNVLLDEAMAAELDAQSGTSKSGVQTKPAGRGGIWSTTAGEAPAGPQYGDSGGASRFFPVFKYQAKAPARERPKVDGVAHPTVKPVELMRWLVRLVTQPGGIVMDPFAGSGTTAEACLAEGMRCLTIEREPTYLPLILARVARAINEGASE